MLNIFLLLVGIGLVIGGVFIELNWRKKLASWKKTTGEIVREVLNDDGGSSAPEIEFQFNGKTIRFVSKYYFGWRMGTAGDQVVVLHDPETGESEELKWSNRWLGTITVGSVGVFLVLAAIFGKI